MILSIVGVDQVPQLAYYRAKSLQEDLLRQGPTPYSIVRATQFFEFMNTLMFETPDDTTLRLPSTRLQPIAAADVAAAVVEVSTGTPLRAIWNVPARMSFPSTNSAGSPWRCSRTTGPSSPTTRPDIRGVTGDVLTAGPDAQLARRTTRIGSRRPGNRAVGYPGTTAYCREASGPGQA